MTEKMTFREHIVQDLGVCPQGIDPDAPGDITIYPFPGWDFGKPGPITVPRQDAIRPDGFNPRSQNGEGEGHFCTRTCETNDVNVGKMDITAEAKDTIAMYAAPAKTATVSVSAGYTGTLSGAHELVVTYSECTECGKIEDEKTPYTAEIEVAWTATAAGKTVECSTWTGPMTKGKGHPIHFAVNATCTACGKTAGSDAAALADVYELSIDKYDEYLGLNLTDAMKGKYVTRTATAKVDPAPPKVEYAWSDCGRCEWRSATTRENVTYGATDKTGPSSSYRAEPLTVGATVTKGDLSASANCTTNFTVVKVDVQLGNLGESSDETVIPDIYYCIDNEDGTLKQRAIDNLCKVRVSCEPNLPVSEYVDLTLSEYAVLYEKIDDGRLSWARSAHKCCEIGAKKFFVHGHDLPDGLLKKAEHLISKATLKNNYYT